MGCSIVADYEGDLGCKEWWHKEAKLKRATWREIDRAASILHLRSMTSPHPSSLHNPAKMPAGLAKNHIPSSQPRSSGDRRRQPLSRRRPFTSATAVGIVSLVLPTFTLVRIHSHTRSVLPLVWTCVASAITFLAYGYDKMQARNAQWRVRESTLQLLALAGGWPGALVGMHYFQHKTRKTSFQIMFWSTVMIWQGMAWALWTTTGTNIVFN
ncbi:hypothetical protein DE146DRAFT_371622 [Phaeosphaeria sp. MPI-PUGE-AT-0046c]|nr:hypothetical protein DE146DRAFT_371622 [Phaeosphaeria sp. MPI-PUGE-AT-0046c]